VGVGQTGVARSARDSASAVERAESAQRVRQADEGGGGRSSPGAPSFNGVATFAEACFRLADTQVRVASQDVGVLQDLVLRYAPCRAEPDRDEITVRIFGAGSGTIEAQFETCGGQRSWCAEERLFPPVRVAPLDRHVWLRASALSRFGHSVLLCGERALVSPLTVLWMGAGASLVGDGLLPIDPDDLLALPLPRSLRLDQHSLSLLHIESAHPALLPHVRSGSLEWRLLPNALPGFRFARAAADIAAIVVVEPSVEPAALRRIDADRSFAALAWYLDAPAPNRIRPVEQVLRRLCARTPSYALGASDPHAAIPMLEQLLA
jgi:hypothetical protein